MNDFTESIQFMNDFTESILRVVSSFEDATKAVDDLLVAIDRNKDLRVRYVITTQRHRRHK